MSSEGKSWNHVRLLHTATEGLQKGRGSSSAHKKERKTERQQQEMVSAVSDPGEGERAGDEIQGKTPSPTPLNPKSEGMDKERMAQLRHHLQAQFSIRDQEEDQSPGPQLVELVGRIIRGEGENEAVSPNSAVESGGQCPACGQFSNPAGCCNGLPAEIEKTLKRELAVLKEEVMGSVESMKREVTEALNSLREFFRAYNEFHVLQSSDLSPLEELDENVPEQLMGGYHRSSQGGNLEDKISLNSEDRFKSRSVPTLHPLPISSKNQAMLRAMSTITAKNCFTASLSRSNSDPVEPMQAKSTVLPLAIPKLVAKKHPTKMMPPPATRSYTANAKNSSKLTSRAMAAHPAGGHNEGKPH